jgi:ectoine hydroxylase-related dioxygenase (phytanoyl-CoA dioxygenase family)
MITPEEKEFFLTEGYLHVPGVLTGDALTTIQSEFDRVWEANKPRVSQQVLLREKTFIDLVEHPGILNRHRAIFGAQTQLLQYDFLRQGPNSDFPLRFWHRDFTFPGDYPLSINTIVYLDDMTLERGPTYVVPRTHRGTGLPPADKIGEALEGELPVLAAPGDVVFINAAIWHSGARNRTEGARRGIYIYYGYWWLKTYEPERPRPWHCLEGADQARLELMGVKMPQNDLHMYDPTQGFPG